MRNKHQASHNAGLFYVCTSLKVGYKSHVLQK
ncbi:hypothetical protein VP242E401_P0010 [Vibrio phage 242E40-1]|nr:hypothetical protein VP242E401_P0010 [Vibrio phage 242E40-1]